MEVHIYYPPPPSLGRSAAAAQRSRASALSLVFSHLAIGSSLVTQRQHTPAEMKAAKKASRKARQAEHHASQKLLRAAERGIQHAAAILAIDAAIVEAERPDQTVPQLITAHETLQQVGVGDGGWQSLVQNMPGYGLPLQEAIARMGACHARMRWRIATQAMSAVDGLLAAGGDVRETTEFKDLSEAFSVLHRLEYAGHLRGLTAGGLIMRVRSLHTRMQRGYSPLRMLRL